MAATLKAIDATVIAGWIETARSLDRSIPEPKGKLAYA